MVARAVVGGDGDNFPRAKLPGQTSNQVEVFAQPQAATTAPKQPADTFLGNEPACIMRSLAQSHVN